MTDNTRRHWHGNPGDRHDQLNVWVKGGPKGPSARAPWALTPEMMSRRDSETSTGSAGSNGNGNTPSSASPTSPAASERRRSSAGSGAGLFSNLQMQKRESKDPELATRRASWNEQREKGGMFSKLWEGYTRGK